MAGTSTTTECKACRVSVRLAPGEVDRILAEYLQGNPAELAGDAEYANRLEICSQCADLTYGTTCRFCGCLVAVRAKLAGKRCANPSPRW